MLITFARGKHGKFHKLAQTCISEAYIQSLENSSFIHTHTHTHSTHGGLCGIQLINHEGV